MRANGNVLPIPAVQVYKLALSDGSGEVAIVEVMPSDLPPVRFKGQVWIRVGPRRAVASETEERRLTERRISHARTFDARPCLGSAVTDLASDLFLNTYRQQAVAEVWRDPVTSVDTNTNRRVNKSFLRYFKILEE